MKELSRSASIAAWTVFGVLLFFFGNWFFFFPLKIFAVFLHESSHAIVTILTGGRVIEVALNPQEGGHALTQGGWRFFTLSAGYLGNLTLGGLIMLAASRSRWDKQIAIGIGVLMLIVTLYCIKGIFAVTFSIVFGLALIAIGVWSFNGLCDVILRIIGFYAAFYAILDIKSDILSRSHLHSDARMLAELTGVPTLIWGAFWFVIAVVALAAFVWLASAPVAKREPLLAAA